MKIKEFLEKAHEVLFTQMGSIAMIFRDLGESPAGATTALVAWTILSFIAGAVIF